MQLQAPEQQEASTDEQTTDEVSASQRSAHLERLERDEVALEDAKKKHAILVQNVATLKMTIATLQRKRNEFHGDTEELKEFLVASAVAEGKDELGLDGEHGIGHDEGDVELGVTTGGKVTEEKLDGNNEGVEEEKVEETMGIDELPASSVRNDADLKKESENSVAAEESQVKNDDASQPATTETLKT